MRGSLPEPKRMRIRSAPLTPTLSPQAGRGRERPRVVAINILVAALLTPLPAAAQGADDLFKGKTLNLVIAAGEGGGFDIAARLAARHLARFLPGEPTIVPQNMPGANGLRAAEYLFRVAPHDGLTIGL